MPRDAAYQALVLKSSSSNSLAGANGGADRQAWFLTSESGILRCTVFGGAKSKLRAYASPFHSGKIWVYHNPVKDTRKLSDFDVQNWRPGLRELYDRTIVSQAACETILASAAGGGDWGAALKLACDTLDALENSNEVLCQRVLVFFFFKWADFLGVMPQLEYCGRCQKKEDFKGVFWYDGAEGEIFCHACIGGGERPSLVRLNPGCRLWLAAVKQIPPSKLAFYTMDNKSAAEAKSFASAILEGALGRRLSSWDW